jgi:hypothetical protein
VPTRDEDVEDLASTEDRDELDDETADEHASGVDEEDEEKEEAVVVAASTDEEGDSAASLEELLAQRAVGKEEDSDEDLMALASERDAVPATPIAPRVAPVADQREFVCSRCHLVKARSQLADPARGLCRDCV